MRRALMRRAGRHDDPDGEQKPFGLKAWFRRPAQSGKISSFKGKRRTFRAQGSFPTPDVPVLMGSSAI
jgi:antibiotic biosynthesis monooxygenase (ABM) superfamily enzyme